MPARCSAQRAGSTTLSGLDECLEIGAIDRVELAELGEPRGTGGHGELVVAFSHPLCTDCRTVLGDLEAGPERWVSVDVRDRPDLARKYGVALVPTVVRVAADGRVLQQMAG